MKLIKFIFFFPLFYIAQAFVFGFLLVIIMVILVIINWIFDPIFYVFEPIMFYYLSGIPIILLTISSTYRFAFSMALPSFWDSVVGEGSDKGTKLQSWAHSLIVIAFIISLLTPITRQIIHQYRFRSFAKEFSNIKISKTLELEDIKHKLNKNTKILYITNDGKTKDPRRFGMNGFESNPPILMNNIAKNRNDVDAILFEDRQKSHVGTTKWRSGTISKFYSPMYSHYLIFLDDLNNAYMIGVGDSRYNLTRSGFDGLNKELLKEEIQNTPPP